MIKIGNYTGRNLMEQVEWNKEQLAIIESLVLDSTQGIKVIGIVDAVEDLPEYPELGAAYLVGTTVEDYELYIYAKGSSQTDWINIGRFPVPSDVPGPQGEIGPQGPQGVRGATWTEGASNPSGIASIGDLYLQTTDYSVWKFSNTGGSLHWEKIINTIKGATGQSLLIYPNVIDLQSVLPSAATTYNTVGTSSFNVTPAVGDGVLIRIKNLIRYVNSPNPGPTFVSDYITYATISSVNLQSETATINIDLDPTKLTDIKGELPVSVNFIVADNQEEYVVGTSGTPIIIDEVTARIGLYIPINRFNRLPKWDEKFYMNVYAEETAAAPAGIYRVSAGVGSYTPDALEAYVVLETEKGFEFVERPPYSQTNVVKSWSIFTSPNYQPSEFNQPPMLYNPVFGILEHTDDNRKYLHKMINTGVNYNTHLYTCSSDNAFTPIPLDGIAGKSAYEAAVSGGWTGTEEEFNEWFNQAKDNLLQHAEQIQELQNDSNEFYEALCWQEEDTVALPSDSNNIQIVLSRDARRVRLCLETPTAPGINARHLRVDGAKNQADQTKRMGNFLNAFTVNTAHYIVLDIENIGGRFWKILYNKDTADNFNSSNVVGCLGYGAISDITECSSPDSYVRKLKLWVDSGVLPSGTTLKASTLAYIEPIT